MSQLGNTDFFQFAGIESSLMIRSLPFGGPMRSIPFGRGRLLAPAVFIRALGAIPPQQGVFTLTSTTFKDGQMMPRKVSNMNPQNPNCVGENVSPQLSWSNPPEGTKSFAILMEDPEARGAAGVHHWVAYGIPPTVTSFA